MRGRCEKAAVPVSPTRSRPLRPAAILRTPRSASSTPARIRAASACRNSPAGGQRHLPGGAVEQRRVQFGLELADRVGQGRLRNEQLLGRPAEVAGVGHRGEVSQVTQLHVLSVRSWSCVMADTFDGKCRIHIEQGHVSALLMNVIDQSSARPGLGNCLV